MSNHQQRSHNLAALAFERFASDLTIREHAILVQSADHDLTNPHELAVEQIAIDPDLAAEADRQGWQLPPERTRVDVAVRAEFIRWLVSDPDVARLVDRRGILIAGAIFPKGLSFRGCVSALPVTIAGCDFSAGADDDYADLDLRNAKFHALSIHSSSLGHIDATGLIVETDFALADTRTGPIKAINCQFGQLTIVNTELHKMQHSDALNLTLATIAGTLTLCAVKTSDAIIFNSCRIGSFSITGSEVGQLDLLGCNVERELFVGILTKFALDKLHAQSALRIVDPNVALHASGVVSISTTSVGGNVTIKALKFLGNGAIFQELKRDRLHFQELSRDRLHNVLNMSGMKVAGLCYLGTIHFDHPSGLLDLRASEFSNDLTIEDLKLTPLPIVRDVKTFEELAHSTGTSGINLSRARISRELWCLNVDLGFATINLRSAAIDGAARFEKVKCGNLVADRLKAGKLHLKETTPQNLTLRDSELVVLADDAASRSLRKGGLYAAGLSVKVFEDLPEAADGNAPSPHMLLYSLAAARIEWLNLQPEEERVSPRPWLSLAAMLDSLGQEREAKRVRYEMRAVYAKLHPNKATGFAIRTFARIRRNPFIVLWWTLGVWAIATGIFSWCHADFIPTGSANAFVKAHDQQREIFTPRFAPPIYALENALPIIKLGQDAAWTPDPREARTYWMLSAVRWLLIIWGWFGGAALAFAVSQKLKD